MTSTAALSKTTKKTATKRSAKPRKPARDPRTIAITAGAIPTLAALLGWIASEVALTGSWLALLPAAMTVAVLTVSLPHVAKGLSWTLRINGREAWALAIAVDLAMVSSEVVLHFATLTASATVTAWAIMLIGLVGSTVYNVAGFRH